MTPSPNRTAAAWRGVPLVLAAGVGLGGCTGHNWGWYVVSPTTAQGQTSLRFLVGGLGETLAVSATAIVASVLLGLVVAMLGLSRHRPARVANRMFVELFRSIPTLVLLLWVFYGLPVVLGLRLDVFTAGVVALALGDCAFEAEIFRAGIQSIDRGQHEAADSLGLSWRHKMRFIVLPQALRRILPPLGNQFVYVLKMSSLVSVIGLGDITRRANELVVTVYRPLEIYTVLVLEYLVLIIIISWLVRRLERRMAASDRRVDAGPGRIPPVAAEA
ncbi:MAG: amino acid ABC transporter permease [Proteobacteria bacterium]|nr:amino acid ABC transporter permease [Pseudomonadota bacterium]